MARVLVTGSLGYIGSVLTPFLEEAGHQVRGIDTGFFAGGLLYAPSSVDVRMDDVRDLRPDDLDDVDAVVHLAGISNDPIGALDVARVYDPTRVYSRDIAAWCKARGVKFIFASSCSIYGLGSPDLMTEDSTPTPQTGYSVNKLQIEQDLQDLSDASFSPIALRFATIFGRSPRLRFDVVVNMLTGMAVADGRVVLNSNGQAWRPNLHILDACEAIRRAIELDYRDGRLLVLNVGDEAANLRVLDLARIVQQATGADLKFLADNPELDADGLIRDRKVSGADTRTYRVSFERIRSAMPGFRCAWSVERGVADMVELFRALPLDAARFRQRECYRLQQLEHLHRVGALSDDLRWQAPRPWTPESAPPLSAADAAEHLSRAQASPRRRVPKILHRQGEVLNRVFNFMMADSYMQPHLHPGPEKVEKIRVLEGRIAVVLFDDQGAPARVVPLAAGGDDYIEIPAFTWHTYVILSPHAITHETMMGKYEPDTWKGFASWAPPEGLPDSGEYLESLRALAEARTR